jgi:hypothetical protein
MVGLPAHRPKSPTFEDFSRILVVEKIPECALALPNGSTVGSHSRKFKDTFRRTAPFEDLSGAPSWPHIPFWRDESEFVHVRTPRESATGGAVDSFDPLGKKVFGILAFAIFFQTVHPVRVSRGAGVHGRLVDDGSCGRSAVILSSSYKATPPLQYSCTRKGGLLPALSFNSMSDQGNIFLTWENLAFSLPLLTVVGAYVSWDVPVGSNGLMCH